MRFLRLLKQPRNSSPLETSPALSDFFSNNFSSLRKIVKPTITIASAYVIWRGYQMLKASSKRS
jgi:hypothetical protein